MRRYITLLLATLTSVVSLAQDKPVPTTAGLYYSSPSGPSRLELATNSGFKTTGVAKSAFSYGIAKAKGKWLYRNPAAMAQFPDHRPVFTLVSQIDGLNTGNRVVEIRREERSQGSAILRICPVDWCQSGRQKRTSRYRDANCQQQQPDNRSPNRSSRWRISLDNRCC